MEDLLQRYFWPNVTRITGITPTGEGSVTLIGDRPSTRYFAQRFFSGNLHDVNLGAMPVAQIISRISRYCDESDLVIGRLAAPFSRTMARLNACSAPLMVQPKLHLPLSEKKRTRFANGNETTFARYARTG